MMYAPDLVNSSSIEGYVTEENVFFPLVVL